MDGREHGKDVNDHQDKDPAVVEREGQVQEDDIQEGVGGVVFLEAVVDKGHGARGKKQGDQREEGVASGLSMPKRKVFSMDIRKNDAKEQVSLDTSNGRS